jgi:hypothetical protein
MIPCSPPSAVSSALLPRLLWICFIAFGVHHGTFAQHGYWQQEVHYKMDVSLDDTKHQLTGTQTIVYTNHSPDTLHRIFYHLYFNAFQPGSMMDVRSRTILDPDPRISDRISRLNPDEIGFHHIKSLKQDGQALDVSVVGTVAEVALKTPLLPGASTQLDMKFESQVPVQIRRSGRNNQEGVDYTMTQWYPKLAEYDRDGWHTAPYVAREFHGVFGTFEVNIELPSSYTVAGTGVVQNPEEVGHGYARTQATQDRVTWRFKAEQVHDFAWAADQSYRHVTTSLNNGTTLHFFHLEDSVLNAQWDKLIPLTKQLFEIMNARFGVYPYPQFSVIQGGDGGMEYPMCTMITGEGSFGGLVSVTVHEAIHNWYYGVLASNETKYPWMDEGFTTFAQNIVLDSLFQRHKVNPHKRSYDSYISKARAGGGEPMSTEADLYETNEDYGVNAYSKGCVFLAQLSAIIGDEVFDRAMRQYFNQWKFKHPTPTDFKRVMERASGMELDWYFDAWIGTTKQIDYGIHKITSHGHKTRIELERLGSMPMPVQVMVISGSKKQLYHIPLQVMRNATPPPKGWNDSFKQLADWPWAYPFYEFEIDLPADKIDEIIVDPFLRLADINDQNNRYPNGNLSFPAYKP